MTLEDMEESDEGIEFIYIFTSEQEWKYCCPVSPDMRWRNVRNELAAESEIFAVMDDAMHSYQESEDENALSEKEMDEEMSEAPSMQM